MEIEIVRYLKIKFDMLNILIVDDEKSKIEKIISVINELGVETFIETAVDVKTTEAKLLEVQFDILILDLYIPTEYGKMDEKPENARDLMDHIRVDDDFFKPYFVIGNTGREDTDEFKEYFSNHLYYLLKYDLMDDGWKDALKSKVLYFSQLKNKIQSDSRYDYDVAFVIALQKPEFSELLRINGYDWKKHEEIENDQTSVYYTTKIKDKNGKDLRIVASYADQMGMCASSLLATKMIYSFHPKYIMMTGICAATEKDIHLGDILVVDQSWNGGSGKLLDSKEGETLFLPEYHHEILDPKIKTKVLEYCHNREFLDMLARDFGYDDGTPEYKLNLHCVDVTSVSAVTQSKKVVETLRGLARKLGGLEMEAYGLYYAAKHTLEPAPTPIVIKAAADYADEHKDDNFQQYCAYISAKFAFHLIVNDLKF